MESKKALEYIESLDFWVKVGDDRQTLVVHFSDAEKAVEMAEEEIQQKAIDAYIENCEYKSDWCCGCAESHGAILSEPDVCMGRDCPYVKGFIEKLNS